MLSSSFGAEQRINKPLSALASLTGRHTEIKQPRPKIYYNRPNSSPTDGQRKGQLVCSIDDVID